VSYFVNLGIATSVPFPARIIIIIVVAIIIIAIIILPIIIRRVAVSADWVVVVDTGDNTGLGAVGCSFVVGQPGGEEVKKRLQFDSSVCKDGGVICIQEDRRVLNVQGVAVPQSASKVIYEYYE
jgi:hypothetical protein